MRAHVANADLREAHLELRCHVGGALSPLEVLLRRVRFNELHFAPLGRVVSARLQRALFSPLDQIVRFLDALRVFLCPLVRHESLGEAFPREDCHIVGSVPLDVAL